MVGYTAVSEVLALFIDICLELEWGLPSRFQYQNTQNFKDHLGLYLWKLMEIWTFQIVILSYFDVPILYRFINEKWYMVSLRCHLDGCHNFMGEPHWPPGYKTGMQLRDFSLLDPINYPTLQASWLDRTGAVICCLNGHNGDGWMILPLRQVRDFALHSC